MSFAARYNLITFIYQVAEDINSTNTSLNLEPKFMNNINQAINFQKLAHRFAFLLVTIAISSTVLLPVRANAQKKVLDDLVLFQISSSVCKNYVTIKPKNEACNLLTVSGMFTLNGSRLDPTGVDIKNNSQRETYFKKAVDVLSKDKSFMNFVRDASSHLTREEARDILQNITIAYWVLKNKGI